KGVMSSISLKKIIKMMITVDGIEIKKNETKESLADIEKEYNRVTEERLANKEKYAKRIEELKKERLKFKNFEDKKLISLYQDLQKENEGVAIATVEDGVCTGCNVEVSKATSQKLDYNDRIVFCQRCGRILLSTDKK
ncbi:MAG TPA: C4-type zinc ribbon domain-containing protein, partial [bacterium]|nr:C4-type zinc ribbon domain-containing protein [bacterium]